MVEWARFEYLVQQMAWEALDLHPVEARIALREPRITDRLGMVRDILEQRGATLDKDAFVSIYSRSSDLASQRDLLAHGIWGHHFDEWHIRRARGPWAKNLHAKVGRSRTINPEMVPMTLTALRKIRTEVQTLADDLSKLRKTVVGPPRRPPQTR